MNLTSTSGIETARIEGIKRYWQLALALLLVAVLATSADVMVAKWEAVRSIPGDLRRIIRLTEIFAHGFGVFVVSLGVWTLAPQMRRHIPRLIGCAMLPAGAAALIKLMIYRKRPAAYMDARQIKMFPQSVSDSWDANTPFVAAEYLSTDRWNAEYMIQSFPSAHSATVAGLAIGMTWLFPRGRNMFILFAVLASFQRITSSAHWCSDVFAGATIGVLLGGAMTCNWGLGYLLGKFEQTKTNDVASNSVAENRPCELAA